MNPTPSPDKLPQWMTEAATELHETILKGAINFWARHSIQDTTAIIARHAPKADKLPQEVREAIAQAMGFATAAGIEDNWANTAEGKLFERIAFAIAPLWPRPIQAASALPWAGTEEIPAIVNEAEKAGCENDVQTIGYLAAEVSRLRGILNRPSPAASGEGSRAIRTAIEIEKYRSGCYAGSLEDSDERALGIAKIILRYNGPASVCPEVVTEDRLYIECLEFCCGSATLDEARKMFASRIVDTPTAAAPKDSGSRRIEAGRIAWDAFTKSLNSTLDHPPYPPGKPPHEEEIAMNDAAEAVLKFAATGDQA